MNVLDLVAREVRRLRGLAQLAGAAVPAMAALAVLTFGATWLARGRWLVLPPVVPLVVWAAAMATLVLAGGVVLRRLRARAETPVVAAAIEHEQELRRGELTGLLEVADTGGVFADHAARALGARLAGVGAHPAPRYRRRLLRAAVLATIAFAQVLVLATASWARRPDGWRALLSPMDAWRGTLIPTLRLVDVPARVARGAPLIVAVDAPGRARVELRWRETGGAWRDSLVAVDAAGGALVRIAAVDADLAILADDGRTLSDTAHVRVVDRPFVGEVTILARFPGYLGRAPERLIADEPLRLPAGTSLEIRGRASEPVAAAALVGETSRAALVPDGLGFSGRFTPRESGAWSWQVQGQSSPIEDVPAPLQIDLIPDAAPRPEIVAPVGEVLVAPFDVVTLDALAEDDNALTGVWLRTWVRTVAGVDGPVRERQLSTATEPTWVGIATVEMQSISVRPGDAVIAVLVARDAAPLAREGRSAEVVLRVPTAEQAREAARSVADAAVAAAEAAARAQAALAERTATEARTRSDRAGGTSPNPQATPNPRASPNPQAAPDPARAQGQQGAGRRRDPLSFEGAERARDLAAQQRDLQEQVERLQQAAAEMEERLRRAGALDEGLAQQLRDAQKLLQEAMTPEMAASLENLEDATQQLDGDRTRQSLADLAAQQQRLREVLDKSAELLRRAALEGAMQTTADRGQELAEAQRAFADSAVAGEVNQSRAEQLEAETRSLERAMEQLRQRLEQAGAQQGSAAMQQASAEAQQSAEALGESARDRAAPQRAASAMERAAQSLERARSGQVSQWREELTNALDQSVQETLQMAREQDALADRTRQDPTQRDIRAQQSALQQGVGAAQERLDEQARRSALVTPRSQELMERARQRAEQATREATAGARGQTEQAMRESADALRQAAAQLTRDRERAGAAQSATGMPELLQRLSQLAQQQGGLNSMLQGLLPGNQPQQSDAASESAARAEAAAAARQLARAQRDVARQLEEAAGADPSGRAQELAREARAIAQALDQGAVDPAQAARQERLLRRMLDAGRSLEQDQQDESQRRESRAATSTQRFTPGAAAESAAAQRYRVPTWEELRGLSADDRRLVIEYFRRLNAESRP